MEVARLNISGMHCSACSATIEKNLSKLETIKNVKINPISGKAKISHTDSISQKEIIKLITSYGFPTSVDDTKEQEIRYISDLKLRLSVALPLFFIIFGLHMANFHGHVSAIIQFILATFVQFYCAYPFYKGSLSFLKTKSADMNILIALGTSVAYFYSLYLLFVGSDSGYYFEGSSSIVCFVLLGEYLKSKAKKNANDEFELLTQILPDKARILVENKQKLVDIKDIKEGDICLVLAGEKVSADGIIIDGKAEVSSTHINGEEIPRVLSTGDSVVAGSVVYNGELKIKSAKDSSEFFVYEMLDLLELSHTRKPNVGLMADKVASIFVPFVIILSVLAFVFWLSIGYSFAFSLSISACILVVSCPCALGLAVPLAIVCSSIRAKRSDILIKIPEVYERVKKIKYVVFDKTGTLTNGDMSIKRCDIFEDSSYERSYILSIAKSMQENNPHPISKAILEFTKEESFLGISEKEYLISKGIRSIIDGKEYYFGSTEWIASILDSNIDLVDRNGAIILSDSVKVLAVFYLSDSTREESRRVVDYIVNRGIVPVILSGDNIDAVSSVANKLGISRFHSNLSPTQKVDMITNLMKDGDVCFVGDGINDSLALKESSIGISFVGATELAKEVGDILLLKNNLCGIVDVFKLSDKTISNIKQNLFFAYIYNITLIPIAAGLLYPLGILMTPSIAGMAMALSSVSVVSNALRILRIKL